MGDRSAKPVFEGRTPFNVLGGGYQRPFELATLRLSNMVGILPKCAPVTSAPVLSSAAALPEHAQPPGFMLHPRL